MAERIALVMAGGGGTRLWPASTAERPKQLLDPLLGSPGNSLLADTIARLEGLVQSRDVYVVTTAEQVDSIRTALPTLTNEQIIVEPRGRNTAPCIALGVVELRARRGSRVDDATLLVLPADHHVADPDGFRRLAAAACAHAEAGDAVVTLGIEPTHAATGFGYIERGEAPLVAVPDDGGVEVFGALAFEEKPDSAHARRYLESGRHLWNAGIFIMPVQRIATELERHCPQTWQALHGARTLADGSVSVSLEQAYARVKAEPIDVAVMEKLADLRVVPARIGWTDLGSWRALHGMVEHDAVGNAVLTSPKASATLVDVEGSLVWSEDAQVGVLGVRDLCIVVSDGRVLVCPIDRAEDVRALVDRLGDRQ
jgi:mannose-1-phosphate guanylyltransferase